MESKVFKMSILSFITVGVLIAINTVDFNIPALTALLKLFRINTITNEFSVVFYRVAFPKITITLAILVVSAPAINLLEVVRNLLLRFYD